ncbi:hypothetical protein QTQ03_07025 [Micromonospora sp. WMMA1363]|nr:hypothetical protein [Micromonospora sp. WMMA1363]MDM4719360.1 hypothetical protein [Micromonospora sp. WMMA1363]
MEGRSGGQGDESPTVIVVSGASSGFGALTARALARAGHTVYAGIRDTGGRDAPRATDILKHDHAVPGPAPGGIG